MIRLRMAAIFTHAQSWLANSLTTALRQVIIYTVICSVCSVRNSDIVKLVSLQFSPKVNVCFHTPAPASSVVISASRCCLSDSTVVNNSPTNFAYQFLLQDLTRVLRCHTKYMVTKN
jgi:hypothetical protein